MTHELTVEQKLEVQVKDLKSRILDTQDALSQSRQSEQELAAALTEIVKLLKLESETGQIAIGVVVQGVADLVQPQLETAEGE